jgi:hypothetical protein
MKNVRLIFVLLLIVNCTADLSEIAETSETSSTLPQAQLCIDDLPRVMLTNNGTHSFDFIVYADDYSVLHTQNLSTTTDSGWVELSSNNVIIVVTNNTVYGQKIQLNLVPCDNKELEIDTNNVLSVTGG